MKQWIHALLLALLAIGVGLLYLEEPQFGDDFTYWSYGYDVHEQGLAGWKKDGFHQLRWPVWGLCWAAQGVFGFGVVSYYFVPFLMLVLGSLFAYAIGRHIFQRTAAGWMCGILFLLHPLLDANLTRPYPDVGEGLIGAAAILAWWFLMHAETRGWTVLWSIACGFFLFVAEENRLTGVFFIPLLGCLTLLFFRQRFLRIFWPLAVFAVLLAGQMYFYHVRFDRWDHFIQANAGAKGRKGTEAVTATADLWKVPFRFLDSLHKGSDLMSFYAVFGALGLWFGWRNHGRAGRVVIAWFVLLYLAYACAPQQIWPFRPMLREADRFLSALAIPYTLLAAFGIIGLLRWISQLERWPKLLRAAQWARQHPGWMNTIGFVLLAVAAFRPIGNRTFATLGYVPELRAYMRNLPTTAVIFTHRPAMVLAHMVDHDTASKMHWLAQEEWITEPKPKLIADAAKATDFWYIRKLALMRLAKGISTEDENRKLYAQPKLASWFDAPEREWQLSAVFAKTDNPDIVLYRRRMPETPPPLILTPQSPELKDLLPPLPFAWNRKSSPRNFHDDPLTLKWPLPASLRGKLVRVEMACASEQKDAFAVQIAFGTGSKFDEGYSLKPYFFRDGGKEFVCMPIPATADHCLIRVRMADGTDWVKVTDVRVIAE